MPSTVIIIFGAASNKEIARLSIEKGKENLNRDLMDILRQNGIPIASSCYGEGICTKCTLTIGQTQVLSCQIKLNELTEDKIFITIDYL